MVYSSKSSSSSKKSTSGLLDDWKNIINGSSSSKKTSAATTNKVAANTASVKASSNTKTNAFQSAAKSMLGTSNGIGTNATFTPLYNNGNSWSSAVQAAKNTYTANKTGSGTSTSGATTASTPSSGGNTTDYVGSSATYTMPTVKQFQASDATIAAMNQTQALLDKVNSGKTSYSDKLAELLSAYSNRDSFSYDPNNDLLFQNALQGAMSNGQAAMRDTMGQAADLTGGYGSSYATSVASQSYNNYLQEAYNNLPEYYQLAYNEYNNESEDLLNELNMYNTLDQQEYTNNLNAYNASNTNWQALYNQDYAKWADEFNQSMTLANYNLDKAVAENNMALNNKNYELNKQETEAKLKQYAAELESAKSQASTIDTSTSTYLTKIFDEAFEEGGLDAADNAFEIAATNQGLSEEQKEALYAQIYASGKYYTLKDKFYKGVNNLFGLNLG